MADESKGGAAAKGKDNNKRLMALEAGVSGLAIAIAAAGIELKEGQDPLAQATAIVGRWHDLTLARGELGAALAAAGFAIEEGSDPIAIAAIVVGKYADLGVQIGELADYLLANNPGAIDGTAGACATAIKVLTALTDRAEAAEAALEHANGLISGLEAQLEAAGDLAEVVAAPDPVERSAENARECGPDAPTVDRDDLKAMMGEGQAFELVFSDGAKEIVTFEPKTLAAGEFRRLSNGRYLVMPAIVVKGGAAAEQVHGASLFVNGEHASYCALEKPLNVQPGDQRQFAGALSF